MPTTWEREVYVAMAQRSDRRRYRHPLALGSTLGSAVITGIIAGASSPVQAAGHTSPPSHAAFVDAHGVCPRHPTPGSSTVCRTTRAGNAVAGTFNLPFRPWGITYAYNCGRHAGDFYVVLGLPSMDGQMPETGFSRHGRSGRGYYMETGRADQSWHTLPSYWRNPDNIEILSTCSWHVRAILGTTAVVARYVPAIPAP